MKTKNNPNQRQENIIRYLNEHDEVTTEEIKTLFKIAKSTLSEDIKFLRSKGYPIVTKYGYISLEKQGDNDAIPYYEKLCPSIIRKWIIMHTINLFFDPMEDPPNLLSLYDQCKAMYSALTPMDNAMSQQVFHKDIKELIQDGYLEYNESTRELLRYYKCINNREKALLPTNKTPKVAVLDQATAYSLFYFLENETASVLFADLKKRLLKHWPKISPSLLYDEKNIYPLAIPDILEHFLRSSYQTNCLDITCQSDGKKPQNTLYKGFETAEVIYDIEKRKFYIYGRCITDGSAEKDYFLLPLERITNLRETTEQYDKRRIYQWNYSSMFDASPDSTLNADMPQIAHQEKQKWQKRYEEAFQLEYKENINECLS